MNDPLPNLPWETWADFEDVHFSLPTSNDHSQDPWCHPETKIKYSYNPKRSFPGSLMSSWNKIKYSYNPKRSLTGSLMSSWNKNLIQLQPEKIIPRILDVILRHKLNTVMTQKQNIRNPDYSRIQIMDTIVGNGVLSRWQQKFWSVQKIFWKMFYGGLLL